MACQMIHETIALEERNPLPCARGHGYGYIYVFISTFHTPSEKQFSDLKYRMKNDNPDKFVQNDTI